MSAFAYVGPEKIREAAQGAARGAAVESRGAAVAWYAAHGAEERGWATYTVSTAGVLYLAPRRSEHVACAGGDRVLAAGELRLDRAGAVLEASNNSTGYCPREDCWGAVRDALDRAGIARPEGFTFVAVFRRCEACGERNLVKDEWYVCAVCDAELPRGWNFGDPGA